MRNCKALAILLVSLLLLPSCWPFSKKKSTEKEKKATEGWVWSRERRAPRGRGAITYTRRPYTLPKEKKEVAKVPVAKPTLPIFFGRLKYRVAVMGFEEEDRSLKGLGEVVAQRFAKLLEESGGVVVIEMKRVQKALKEKVSSLPEDPHALWECWKAFGVQAVVTGSLRRALVGGEEKRGVVAQVKMEVRLYSTETGTLVRCLHGQNPLFVSQVKGEFSRNKALLKAIDYCLKDLREGILLGLTQLEWTTSVASVKGDHIYINAGRRSGLRLGDEVEVFGPGREVTNPYTGEVLGRVPGEKKAKAKVVAFLGLDSAELLVTEGTGTISAGDMVKLAP